MKRLGISLYPDQSSFEANKAYLDLAHHYGYSRIFTSLLQLLGEDGEDLLAKFSQTIDYANQLGFKTIVDINPALFKELKISYDDLSFFKNLHVWGLRLDEGFTGAEEARMTHNPYGLKIELNMSRGTNYLASIMAYDPDRDNLIGCHNFYPQAFTGLSDAIFGEYSQQYRHYGLHTAAFVSSANGKIGPWPIHDGLPTMESDRHRDIASQTSHLVLTGQIDDVIIGNAFASEAELKAVAATFLAPYPVLHADMLAGMTPIEEKIAFAAPHLYRGDASAYLLRDTKTRITYSTADIPAHDNGQAFERGDILVVNSAYGRYKGELQIVLTPFKDDGQRNRIGRICADDLGFLELVKPWSTFVLEKRELSD
ncbi:DUF871 domain-containing protein [Lacticaseibacillus zeae]|uniref:MupG family TIM beta-alpha barrel fold protein n=1 Tax=Lacticaseibacillus zeae subsp. silagei TaxID=3068307 RepID=A0ABD7Z998_LACZE|nr:MULTISPECIES: MupG family TIM beta-alpha barrel fold protein [Lacticaseibacillus]MDE3316728.1 MupG family TIM beta-alpha barrel fold protein [Lacticaseibacillus zeae]OFR96189.1 hypothetical protein HMPREF2861_08405 [Lactobacillus sp. HMSC068F07]WLV83520.1 MupG family TIM beta-alpha barrel fold protein [Lacticaseibacillus sp. NCIMB 15475]WLV86269.1 MupG family TIM beta-alpha barrel fold protein [Lacticaseibacillus sp. NCIMB 15474]